jgi:hypothetical protein
LLREFVKCCHLGSFGSTWAQDASSVSVNYNMF